VRAGGLVPASGRGHAVPLVTLLFNARAPVAGEVRADVDCGAQARLFVALMQGLHVVARAEPDPRPLDDVVETALAALTPAPARTAKRTRAAR
jgi:hypothetical protein